MLGASYTVNFPEAPDIQLRGRVNCGHNTYAGSIGCHVTALWHLTGVKSAQITQDQWQLPARMRASKEKFGVFSDSTKATLNALWEKHQERIQDIAFREFVRGQTWTPHVIFSCPVNLTSQWATHTAWLDFAKWIVRNKEGVLVRSPIIVNPLHNRLDNLSLVRTWTWIPKQYADEIVEDGSIFTGGGKEDLVAAARKRAYASSGDPVAWQAALQKYEKEKD